jgi:alkyl hydroperoxide reductase subunit AhpC
MHPGDFTPVCTTELGRAASLESEFSSRNVKLVGYSCNDGDSHRAWIDDIKEVTGAEVTFPLFCDPTRENSVKLGIIDETNKDAKGLPLTVRSVFILKPDRTIALIMTYPASTGRNFDEILRVVDSLQLTDEKKTATPVDWKQGDEVLVNFPLTDAMADETFGKVRSKFVHSVNVYYF